MRTSNASKVVRQQIDSIPRDLARDILRVFLPQVASVLIHEGKLSLVNKSDDDVFRNLLKGAKDFLATHDLSSIMDYRKDLLRNARESARGKKLELAAVFYATYFEHQINGVIADVCLRKSMPKLAKPIIRETNIAAKCSWVLEVLGCKPIGLVWRKRILDISDARNAFVHYKWTAFDESSRLAAKQDLARKLQVAETVVQYLRRYEDQAVHHTQGARLRRLVRTGTKK